LTTECEDSNLEEEKQVKCYEKNIEQLEEEGGNEA
jgi:hypothetical protein